MAASEQANGAQVRSPRAPEASPAAPGRPAVSRAGTSSPRSVPRWVPEASVSWSTVHEAQPPDWRAGLASGPVTPSVRGSGIAAESGFVRSRWAAFVTQGAVR